MRANLTKAVEEHNHVSLNPNNSGSSNDASSSSATSTVSPYISQIQSSASVGASFLGKLLNFEHAVSAAQGKRPEMEDAHFIMEIDHFILAGVLDGHGGADVANIASDLIQKGFFYKLREKEGDVYATFDSLFKEIQHQIIKNENLSRQGATAVVTLIDKQTNCIYTATLGDSEANIYTPDEADLSSFKSIPLSCLRDWGSKRDAARYASAATYNEEEEQHRMGAALGEIGAEGKSKYIRFPLYPRTWPWKHEDVDEDIYGIKQCILSCNVHGRLNISRTFGDSVYYQYRSEIYNRKTQTRESAPSEPKEVTSCKPKVTMIELKNIIGNDSEMILVLTSDGLKDYAGGRDLLSVRDRESAIIETIKTHKTSPPQIIADELVNLGLSGVPAESVGDNMTVIAIKIIIASSKV